MYQDTPLGGAVNDGFGLRAGLLQELAGEMAAAGRHAVNARGFAAQAGYMATFLRGGRVLGDRYHVDRASLFQDRDFPVDDEYRRILAGLFGRLYGLDRDRLARVFPGTTALDMGIL